MSPGQPLGGQQVASLAFPISSNGSLGLGQGLKGFMDLADKQATAFYVGFL